MSRRQTPSSNLANAGARTISRPGSRVSSNKPSPANTSNSRPNSRAISRPGSRATRPISRPGSKASQASGFRQPTPGREYTEQEFKQSLYERADEAAAAVFEAEDARLGGDYYMLEPEEESPSGNMKADSFANTGVGIGDWREKTPTYLANKSTLPLEGNWSGKRAVQDNYPLYTYQPKFDALPTKYPQ